MIEKILAGIDKVRPIGRDQWMGCCPVHQDKTPSMKIKDVGNKILIYCHGCGAKGPEVMKALGMPLSWIFGGQELQRGQAEYKLEKTQLDDKVFIAVFEAAQQRGEAYTHADYVRYKLAKSREELRHERREGQAA